MEYFYFEKPTIERKQDAIDYLQEHINAKSKISGSGGLKKLLNGITYEEWLSDVVNCENGEYASINNAVPSTTYFTIRKNDNKIIGMVNLRHYLNDKLYKSGGHIGYGIRPKERNKGYAKIQLYLCLLESQKMGLDKVMIDCDKNNEPSDRTIKALGGVFDREEYEKEKNKFLNVYWIDVAYSIEKYKQIYDCYNYDNNKHKL